MELRRRTWSAAVRLAAGASAFAIVVLVLAARLGGVPDAAVALPLVVASFGASWVQTARIHRDALTSHPARSARVARSHVRPLVAPSLGHVSVSRH